MSNFFLETSVMQVDGILWGMVLIGMTVAYGMTFKGVQAAKRHDVASHRKWMTISCVLVCIWLVAYVTKQLIFGRDHFGGSSKQYWSLYVPLLLVHTGLAMTTIGLGGTNMVIGIRRLRYGIGAGAMVAGVSRHRLLGHIMQWTFGGTILTAYFVYLMLFYWFPA
jgi:putative membrane protein